MTLTDEQRQVSQWLANFGSPAGLPLQINAEGACGIGHVAGFDTIVEVPAGAQTVYVRAALAPLTPAIISLTPSLMAEHFLGTDTGGATWAIDQAEDSLVLWQSAALAGLDGERFDEFLGRFIFQAEKGHERLREMMARGGKRGHVEESVGAFSQRA